MMPYTHKSPEEPAIRLSTRATDIFVHGLLDFGQEGLAGNTRQCTSSEGNIFLHPDTFDPEMNEHLRHWYQTGLGRKYLESKGVRA